MLDAIINKRHYSFCLPFVCGVVAALALAVHPVPGIFKFAFLPIVLDPSILVAAHFLLFHREK